MNKESITNELSLLHFNIRSIKKNYDDLYNYLKSLKIDFSIIDLTETVAQNSQSEAGNKKIPVGVGVSALSFLSRDHTK